MKKARALGTGGVALALAVGLVTVGGDSRAAAAELPRFDDCAEFTTYMRDLAGPQVTAYGLGGGPVMAYKSAPMAEGAAPADARSGASPEQAVGNSPTGTNVQERGVDEPDIAKIDGSRVLSLTGGRLTVVDASGREPELKASLRFPDGQYPNEMLVLDENRVLVLGTAYDESPRPEQKRSALAPTYYRPGSPQVVLTLVNLTDPEHPRITRTAKITGSYISARLTDGVARVVLTSQPRIEFSHPRPGEPEELALARNRKALAKAEAEDFLPARQVLNAKGRIVEAGPLMGCAAVRHPRVHSGLGIISVLTLDTARGKDAFTDGKANGVVANGQLVYASTDRLYIATTDYGWNSPRPAARGDRPEREEIRTRIHAFDATGRSATPYIGSGSVPGYLYGRWALSEHEGFLRVASTTGRPWGPDEGEPSQSSVIVLDERGDELERVGAVSGLGKTERIYAVRWFDDLAAVVTFRQPDPLYLVDLSDPRDPVVRGELKIPGFSRYLHPVGDDRLLGIGQNADAEGRVTGLQISAFDIANIADPARSDTVGYGRGHTNVAHDSRAFTYLPSRRLAVLPAWITQKVPCPPDAQCFSPDGRPGFVGEIQVPAALGIAVGADGNLRKAGKFIADSPILRILPVGQRLAAITGDSVVLLDPESFEATGSVRVAPEQPAPRPVPTEPRPTEPRPTEAAPAAPPAG